MGTTTRTGLSSQLGLVVETTYGTPVTVTRFFPFITEGLMADRTSIESDGIMAGRLTRDIDQHRYGVQEVKGSVEQDLYLEGAAILWQVALGSVSSTSTAGGAPYTHTVTLADNLPSVTIQKGVPETGSNTVRGFTYGGCKFDTWSFSGQAGQPGKFKYDVIGGTAETTGIALASCVFASNAALPFIFTQASVRVSGTAVPCESFEINGNNHLSPRVYAGDAITREPYRAGTVEIGGKATVELTDLTNFGLYRDGTDITLNVQFSDGTNRVSATCHTYLTGSTPTVNGRDVTKYDLTFANVYGDNSDTNAFAVQVVNSGSATA